MTQASVDPAAIGPAGEPRQVSDRVTWLLAPNPGPATFDGTNSWVLHEPGQRGTVIVDPGPDDPAHLSALVDLAIQLGGRVDAILLTHGHRDHSDGLRETVRRTGATVLAADPRWGGPPPAAGPVNLAGLRIDVLSTPGHSSDSLSFRLPDDDVMLTGDTVLGRSAPAILHPDGRVDQMIASLELIRRVLDSGSPLVLPGHGPLVTEPGAQLTVALAAREARLAQVEGAVRDGCHTVGAIAERLYGKFDRRITYMVEATVLAHLRYLRDYRGLSPAVEFDG